MTNGSAGRSGDKNPMLLLLDCEKQLRAAGRPIPELGPIATEPESEDYLLELDRRMRTVRREQTILLQELAEKAIRSGIDPGIDLDKLDAQNRELLNSPVMFPPKTAARIRLAALGDEVVQILRTAQSPIPTNKLAQALNRGRTAAALRHDLQKLEELGRIRRHRHADLRNIHWSPATPSDDNELKALNALWDLT